MEESYDLKLIFGVLVILAVITSFDISIIITPENLREYYGKFYLIISGIVIGTAGLLLFL
jgi:hypothetical protein